MEGCTRALYLYNMAPDYICGTAYLYQFISWIVSKSSNRSPYWILIFMGKEFKFPSMRNVLVSNESIRKPKTQLVSTCSDWHIRTWSLSSTQTFQTRMCFEKHRHLIWHKSIPSPFFSWNWDGIRKKKWESPCLMFFPEKYQTVYQFYIIWNLYINICTSRNFQVLACFSGHLVFLKKTSLSKHVHEKWKKLFHIHRWTMNFSEPWKRTHGLGATEKIPIPFQGPDGFFSTPRW